MSDTAAAPVPAPVRISPFVAALPKVELHLHLVGSASPETVLALSRRRPEAGLPTTLAALREMYAFRDFPHFLKVYSRVAMQVRSPGDVETLLLGLAGDAAASNVRYAEVTVSPSVHFLVGTTPTELAEALVVSRQRALAEHGVLLNWIFDIVANLGDESAWDTARFAIEHRPLGTVALGLAGPEIGFARALYREQFAAARREGLHAVVHAGETTGPGEVWSAVRELGAERIGHGVGAAADPALLGHLRTRGIPLELCPTSNVCTRATKTIQDSPLPRLLAERVPVTLSTDDPGMFGTTLNREYQLCANTFGLSDADLATLARTGITAAYCPDPLRAELLAALTSLTTAPDNSATN